MKWKPGEMLIQNDQDDNRIKHSLLLKSVALIIISLIFGIIGAVAAIKLFPGIIASSLSNSLTQSPPNIENTLQATVTIRARTTVGDNQTAERIGIGLYIKEGKDSVYIITNDHIVKDATTIIVKTSNESNKQTADKINKEVEAKTVKERPENDLAIIQIDKSSNSGLNLPVIASSSNIKIGQKVYALGKPFINSNNYTLTSGIISSLPIDLPKGSPTLLQTDASINPGNSGGPLINSKGQVVAVNTAYMSIGDNVAGIGFAVPIDVVKKFIDEAGLE